MTRKRSKHRPALAGLNPVAKAMSGAAPLTKNDQGYTRMAQIQAHEAALAFANGKGSPRELGQLASAFNVSALLVADHMDAAEHTATLAAWRATVLALATRADGRGTLGELGDLTRGLELHDALLATVTLTEMTVVLDRLKAFAIAGMLMEIPQ